MSKSIAKLIFEYNGNIVKKLRLVQNNPAIITIGKNSSCSVVYVDPEVSRMHAEINFNGDKITIKDINSTNGTYLNGLRIQSGQFCMLNLGDNVTFSNTGNSSLVVSFADDQLGANNSSPASILVDRSTSKKINTNLIWGVGMIILFGIFYYFNKEKNPLNIKLKDLNEPCDYVNTDLKILEDYYEILEENEGEDVADWNHSDKKRAKKLKKRSNQIKDRELDRLDSSEREEMEDCDEHKTLKRLKEDINELEEDIDDIYILNGNNNTSYTTEDE